MLAMTTEAVAAALMAFAVSGGGKVWDSASEVRTCMGGRQQVVRAAASW